MSEQINEVAQGETAATGDAARRNSAEAAALTAGSTPSGQQLHSGSASRLSPKVKGGIIALLAASVLLVSVGAFALTGGFGGQDGSSAQSSAQEAQTTEQGRVTATKVTGEVEAGAESETHSKAESDSSEQNGESDSAAGQNADSDSAPRAAAPSPPPRRRAIPGRKLPAPEASSLLRRTSSPYRCRFPAAPSAIRFPPADRIRSIPAPRPTMRCAPLACPSTRVAPRTEPTLPRSAGLPKKSTAEPPAGCTLSTAARP